MGAEFEALNVLIIGAGRVGERHAKAQRDLNSTVTLFDIIPDKATELAKTLNVTAASNLTKAIAGSNLVYVCTPIDQHLEPITLAIEAGKPIFCEKPLTGSLEEALKIQRLVRDHNTTFIVGNYYTLNGSIFEALNRVRLGEIGKVIGINASYLHNMEPLIEETPWRGQDSFLYDGGVHPVHLAFRVADEPVKSVSASTGIKIDLDYHFPEDYLLTLKFESGLAAQIRVNSRMQVPHGVYLQIFGTEGSIEAHNRELFYRICLRGSERFNEVSVPDGKLPIDMTAEIINNYLRGASSSFYPLPGIDESVYCIKILDAAERSIASRSIIDFEI